MLAAANRRRLPRNPEKSASKGRVYEFRMGWGVSNKTEDAALLA